MTDTITENSEVAAYLAAIRAALEDLPATERDELLEDLEAHLYEVAAESDGGTLEASLGSPTAYAAELRASAGLDPAPEVDVPLSRRIERAVSTSSLWQGIGRALEQPFAVWLRGFLSSLRPAWWVARGWLALFAVVVWSQGGQIENYRNDVVVPTFHYSWFIGLVAVVLAIAASVWVGLRTDRLPTWARHAIVVGNVVVLAYFLSCSNDIRSVARTGYGQSSYGPQPAVSATTQPYRGIAVNGRHPQNIYPYDAQGHLLTGVRLFDDRGQPIQGLAGSNSLGQDLVRVLPSDAAGAIVRNDYPQVVGGINGEDLGVDAVGNPQRPPTAGPAAVSAMAKATPMPTPTIFVPPMAGATPTPAP